MCFKVRSTISKPSKQIVMTENLSIFDDEASSLKITARKNPLRFIGTAESEVYTEKI